MTSVNNVLFATGFDLSFFVILTDCCKMKTQFCENGKKCQKSKKMTTFLLQKIENKGKIWKKSTEEYPSVTERMKKNESTKPEEEGPDR